MNKKKLMLRVAGITAVLAVFAAAGWYLLRPTLPLQQPGRVERLTRMPPDTKEDTRRYLYIDGKDRRMEVVFADGCRGLREKDENGKITRLLERKKDGTVLVYDVDEKLSVKSITVYRKNGKLFSVDIVIDANSFKRVWFAEDGKTPLAMLETGEHREVFTTYDAKGNKRYEEIDEETDGENNQYGYEYGGGRQQRMSYLVYNGAKMPKYRQTAGQNFNYGPQGNQPEVQIELTEEFEPGSMLVARRISSESIQVNGKYETLIKVEVLVNDEVRYVRYLDKQFRIVRMVDKTQSPEEVTNIDPASAAVDTIDPALLKSPDTPADFKLAEKMVEGNKDMHLQRLLVP